MALLKVSDIVNSIKRDSQVSNIYSTLTSNALDLSAINRLRPADRLETPVAVGLFPGRMTGHFAAEGATKTSQDVALNAWSYTVKAMYIRFPVSKLVYTSQQDAMNAIMAEVELGLAEGIDREILRNTDGAFAAGVTTASNVTDVVASGVANYYTNVSDLLAAVEGNGFTVSGIVARNSERGAFRTSRSTDGVPLFTPSDVNSPDSIFGVPVEYVRAGDADAPLRSTTSVGTIRMVAGDWNKGLAWGVYGLTDIEVNPYSDTAWSTNTVEIRAELYMGFAVQTGYAFANLKQG